MHPGTTQEDTSCLCRNGATEFKPHNPPILCIEVGIKYPPVLCWKGIWYLYGSHVSMFLSLVSRWVRFFPIFGIRMGPNFSLGQHIPTHFQGKNPALRLIFLAAFVAVG